MSLSTEKTELANHYKKVLYDVCEKFYTDNEIVVLIDTLSALLTNYITEEGRETEDILRATLVTTSITSLLVSIDQHARDVEHCNSK